jgi:hypothetical protein
MQPVSFPRCESMYLGGNPRRETLRHDGVGAEHAYRVGSHFRNEAVDQRDDAAIVISEMHGVVRSVIHHDPRKATAQSERSWWGNDPRGSQAWQRVPSVQIAPRDIPRTHHPPPAWTYQQRGSPLPPAVEGYRAAPPPHWRLMESRSVHGYDRRRHPESSWDRPSAPPLRISPTFASPSEAGISRLREVAKRALSPVANEQRKKAKGFDMLDLLCSATLEIGPLHDNPMGCSCPKSKCVALYCDCFKAGRRCNSSTCSCLDCKNTVAESGVNGARTRAIRCILARNPGAFTTAGLGNPLHKLPPGEVACNCIRSRCLKLYCSCFQSGKVCNKDVCTCVSCLNTQEDSEGHRKQAIQQCLEKRPDAFKSRVREPGLGCACKNNRCIRKYCECFRTNRTCTDKCSCRQCANMGDSASHDSIMESEAV